MGRKPAGSKRGGRPRHPLTPPTGLSSAGGFVADSCTTIDKTQTLMTTPTMLTSPSMRTANATDSSVNCDQLQEVAIKVFCDPGRLSGLISKLCESEESQHKVACVEEIGLGALLQLNCKHIDPSLCKWLCKNFDPQRNVLNVHGSGIVLRDEDVTTILGVANGGGDGDDSPHDPLMEYWPHEAGKSFRIPLTELEDDLQRKDIDREEFKLKFAIFSLGCFLCPASSDTIFSTSLTWLRGTNSMKQLRWASQVVNYLTESVREVKDGLGEDISGCVFVLLILYADNVQVGRTPPPHFYSGAPRTSTWGTKEIEQFMGHLKALGGVGSSRVLLILSHEGDPYMTTTPHWQDICQRINKLEIGVESLLAENQMLSALLAAHVMGHSIKRELLSLLGANRYHVECMLDECRMSPSQNYVRKRVSTICKALIDLEGKDSPSKIQRTSVQSHSVTGMSSHARAGLRWEMEGDVAGTPTTQMTPNTGSAPPGVDRRLVNQPGGFGRRTTSMDVSTQQHNVIPRRLFTGEEPRTASQRTGEEEDGFNAFYPMEIPKGARVLFKPPPGMKLKPKDLAIATYIFRETGDAEETLVSASHVELRRRHLLSLCPNTFVDAEILTAWACLLTRKERAMHPTPPKWYLPAHFEQVVQDPTLDITQLVTGYKHRYMGTLTGVYKIFIPLNVGNHWFLMIVDMVGKRVWYVDSLLAHEYREMRVNCIRHMVSALDTMLQDRRFYDEEHCVHPCIATYCIEEPRGVPTQSGCDCGVWVAWWMALSDLTKSYQIVPEGDHGRMKLALDLVLKSYNEIRRIIVGNAAEQMEQHMETAVGLHLVDH